MVRLYAHLARADAEGLEHPVLTLAMRLQFEFAAPQLYGGGGGPCLTAKTRTRAGRPSRSCGARKIHDTGSIPFVDTEAAARYLAFSPYSLECYRALGGRPPLYKVGKFVG